MLEMASRSDSISERFLVPSTLRSVVWVVGTDTQTDAPDRLHYPSTLRSVVCASRRVEWCAFSTRCCPVVGQFEEWCAFSTRCCPVVGQFGE